MYVYSMFLGSNVGGPFLGSDVVGLQPVLAQAGF